MVYDFSILSSLILASLLIFIIGYLRLNLTKINDPQTKTSDEHYSVQVNKINIILKASIFFVLAVGLIRLIFIISFSVELINLSIKDSIYSLRFIFVTIQGIVAFIYFFIFLLLLLFYRLKLEFRFKYLNRVLKIVLSFILIDLLISFILYFKISFDLLLLNTYFDNLEKLLVSKHDISNIYVLLFASAALYLIFYFRFQRRRRRFNLLIFEFFFIVTLIIAVYFTIVHLTYFFNYESLLYSGFHIYSYQNWFVGWIWLFLLLSGLGSQIYSLIVLSLKSSFVSVNYCINYTLQLNRIALMCILGISIIAIFPVILIIIIN